MRDEEFEVFLGKIKDLVDIAPTRMDRACRAYALGSALRADDDGTEFKRFLDVLRRKADEDLAARG